MIRPRFLLAALIALTIALPGRSHAQTPPAQSDASEVGNVASVQGSATVTRNGTSSGLKVKDPVFKGDLLKTGANATLGITFDDETTFNLSANASITVNEFVYEEGGSKNSALFNIARGTVAFAANQVAKTGDMKIATPSTTLGIRGTSGVVDVPDGATPGSTGEVAVKLYQDEDGRVGRIELLGQGGARLGLLTRAATGFSLRAGGGGRFAAVALTISPQQIARDRGLVQRTFAARNVGRQMVNQRRSLRGPNQQRNQNLRQPSGRQPGQPRQGTLPSGRQGVQRNGPNLQGQPGRNNTPGLRQQNLQQQPGTPNTRQKAAPRKPPNERERRGR